VINLHTSSSICDYVALETTLAVCIMGPSKLPTVVSNPLQIYLVCIMPLSLSKHLPWCKTLSNGNTQLLPSTLTFSSLHLTHDIMRRTWPSSVDLGYKADIPSLGSLGGQWAILFCWEVACSPNATKEDKIYWWLTSIPLPPSPTMMPLKWSWPSA